MGKKVLVLDIDGTLTNSKKEITRATKEAIWDVIDRGHKVVLASGRPTPGMRRYEEELELPLHQWGIKEVQVGPFRLHDGSDGDDFEWFYVPCPTSIFSDHYGTGGDRAGQRPLAVQVEESASLYYGTLEEMIEKMKEFDRPMVLWQL